MLCDNLSINHFIIIIIIIIFRLEWAMEQEKKARGTKMLPKCCIFLTLGHVKCQMYLR